MWVTAGASHFHSVVSHVHIRVYSTTQHIEDLVRNIRGRDVQNAVTHSQQISVYMYLALQHSWSFTQKQLTTLFSLGPMMFWVNDTLKRNSRFSDQHGNHWCCSRTCLSRSQMVDQLLFICNRHTWIEIQPVLTKPDKCQCPSMASFRRVEERL